MIGNLKRKKSRRWYWRAMTWVDEDPENPQANKRLKCPGISQWARKFKKVQAKKLVKSNKSISRMIFFTKFHFFAISKNGQKSIFELGKVKTAKHAISREKN